MDKKQPEFENECPPFDSEAWKNLSEAEKEKCQTKINNKSKKLSTKEDNSKKWNYIVLGLVILTGIFYFIANWVRVSKGYFVSQGWVFLDNFSWLLFSALLTGFCISFLLSKTKIVSNEKDEYIY